MNIDNSFLSVKEAFLLFFFYFISLLLGLGFLSKIAIENELLLSSIILIMDSFVLIGVCLVFLKIIKKLPLSFVGIKKTKAIYYIYGIVYIIIMFVIYKLLLFSYSFTQYKFPYRGLYLFIWLFNFVIFGPIAEEIYFRGILFKAFEKKYSFIWASIISALIFALAHFGLKNSEGRYYLMGANFINGIAYALLFHCSKSIFPCFVAHSALNFLNVIWWFTIGK